MSQHYTYKSRAKNLPHIILLSVYFPIATPTMYELSDFVGKLADKWIFIGIRLGLENAVKALKTSPNNADAKLTDLFQKWIDGGHKSIGNQVIEVSWDYLIKQLRTDFISMGGVADEIEGTLKIQSM